MGKTRASLSARPLRWAAENSLRRDDCIGRSYGNTMLGLVSGQGRLITDVMSME